MLNVMSDILVLYFMLTVISLVTVFCDVVSCTYNSVDELYVLLQYFVCMLKICKYDKSHLV